MSVSLDINKGKKLAELLYSSFSTVGIHGQTEMPEDEIPEGIERGSLEHILFITLTVSIDYMRDAHALWESARKTFEDPKTRYLFEPKLLAEVHYKKIVDDMKKYNLAKRPNKDSLIWKTVSTTFENKWNSNPLNFLDNCDWNSLTILECLKNDNHKLENKKVHDFPHLRGPKIGPLWIRMLRDNVGISKIKNLDKISIPIDIHIARSSLATGVVYGEFNGKLNDLFEHIGKAWFESVNGLKINGRDMIALDVDEPLWHLSKYGCTHRDKLTGECPVFDKCEAKEFCINGKLTITKGRVIMETWNHGL